MSSDRRRDLRRRDERSKLICRSVLVNEHALPSQFQFPESTMATARVVRPPGLESLACTFSDSRDYSEEPIAAGPSHQLRIAIY